MIIIDNTVLSNFALVNCLDLLSSAVKHLSPMITLQVYEEFQAGIQKGLFDDIDIGWIEVANLSIEENRRYKILSERFGRGEASCIAVALERNITLATDDMKARKLFQQFGGTTIGTLGILVSLVDKKSISFEEANFVLNQMIKEGYFSPVKSLSELQKI